MNVKRWIALFGMVAVSSTLTGIYFRQQVERLRADLNQCAEQRDQFISRVEEQRRQLEETLTTLERTNSKLAQMLEECRTIKASSR